MVALQRWSTTLGLGLWAVACWRTVLAIVGVSSGHHDVSGVRGIAYLVAFAGFGATLAIELARPMARRARLLVGLEVASGLVMLLAVPRYLNELLLAYVAWQLGLHLPARGAIALTAIQAVVTLAIMAGASTWNAAASQVVFQAMAVTSSLIATRELRARRDLEVVNAQLAATREELAVRTRSAERGRIARELHDTIGHHLTALSLQLELASLRCEGVARDALVRSQHLARAMLGDVRAVASAFDDRVIADVPAALRELADGFERPRAHLTLHGDLQLADPLRAQVLVRCVQELLTNVLKHASAEHVWIDVRADGAWVEARVSDDGVASGASTAGSGGRGIAGMKRRLAEIGGELAITRSLDRGWAVTARLPRTATRPE